MTVPVYVHEFGAYKARVPVSSERLILSVLVDEPNQLSTSIF